ncbi:methyltransferase [Pseudarthrobacter sp. NBSH8]|uniref:methyltransferase n=1 Tax=Pseudarthrobacter sp. NBSH8 TaxID=2596911 RepID=UPI00162A7629|nr:methyltransferase [Pseudarthrobacter sp. NBSH8]QNE14511.1 hypothetical protein FYJ92_08775 [Pseudarthrobacter sp. NBSH8]
MAKAASHARAWIGTIIFLFLAPGVVAGLIPWLFSGWQRYDGGGAAWVVVPIAPTQALVVTGIYRFVRNPMSRGGGRGSRRGVAAGSDRFERAGR